MVWFKRFDNDDLTTKHCYFGYTRSSDVDDIKILIKMTRLQNIVLFILMFSSLLIFIKKFDLINIEDLEHMMLCNEVIMIKLLNLPKAESLGSPLQLHIFSKTFSILSCTFFTPRVFFGLYTYVQQHKWVTEAWYYILHSIVTYEYVTTYVHAYVLRKFMI